MLFKVTVVAMLALATGLAHSSPMLRSKTRVGDVTFFNPALGACGVTNSASDLIVAVSTSFFDSRSGGNPNPNLNPLCGRRIRATTAGGKSVTVKVEDRCTGCAANDLDMSPAAFKKLAKPGVGRLHGVHWVLL